MRYETLISAENLTLAWRRISTGANLQYKQHFRSLFNAYEVAAPDHIARLHERLRGGWLPSPPSRFYIPKPSGLQRPLSLLRIEDQIVLQAFANVAAERLRPRRVALDNKVVFSNLLNPLADSIFFFRDWRSTYAAFERRRFGLLFQGNRWIANFDLAAFYDTISHELLFREIAPRGSDAHVWAVVRGWLKCWSVGRKYWQYDHGIPQGPIACDLLAEVLLNGVDVELQREGITYVRYADDITIFGKSRAQVQDAALHLEQVCRGHGLIPQVGKFAIRRIGAFDPTFMLPSLAPPDQTEVDGPPALSVREAEQMMASALGGRPQKVIDKTRARFVLYRAPKSQRLRRIAVRLITRHPEHIDAVAAHLARYERSAELEEALVAAVDTESPYPYVRGICWSLLAGIAGVNVLAGLRDLALQRLKSATPLEERVGAFRFLLVCQESGLGRITHRLASQPTEVVLQLISGLPDEAYEPGGLVERLLRSRSPEIGITLGEQLVERQISHRDLDLRVSDLAPEVQTAYRRIGLVRRRRDIHVDQVSDLLKKRFYTANTVEWITLLGRRYGFALSLLIQADALYDFNRSHWLQLQNSFNDLATKSFIGFLNRKRLPGAIPLKAPKGHLLDFGRLVEASGSFASVYPAIAVGLREANARRNHLPASHPLEKKRGIQTRYLRKVEQRRHVRALKTSFDQLISFYTANR